MPQSLVVATYLPAARQTDGPRGIPSSFFQRPKKGMQMTDSYTPKPDMASVQALAATLRQQRPGTVTLETLPQLRAAMLASYKAREGVEERVIPGIDGHDVPVRIIRPSGPATAVVVTNHSSGWVIGAALQDDALNSILVEKLGVATVSVDYRLAPEHPFPAAATDIWSVGAWLDDAGEKEFGTPNIIMGGHSAGAHLTAVWVIRARDERPDLLRRVNAVFLTYGAYDLGEAPSVRLMKDDSLIITREQYDSFQAFAFPGLDLEAKRDPAISPLYADLAGLPPALITVGSLDPLLDDSLFLAARWEAAGNDTALDAWPGCVHGFVDRDPGTAALYTERLTSWLGARIHRERG